MSQQRPFRKEIEACPFPFQQIYICQLASTQGPLSLRREGNLGEALRVLAIKIATGKKEISKDEGKRCVCQLWNSRTIFKTSSSAPGIFPFLNGDVNVVWAGCGSSLLWHFFSCATFCERGVRSVCHKKNFLGKKDYTGRATTRLEMSVSCFHSKQSKVRYAREYCCAKCVVAECHVESIVRQMAGAMSPLCPERLLLSIESKNARGFGDISSSNAGACFDIKTSH